MATVNFNIGVLGHVDSGKTSLCKALSVIGSTAAFDKNPQSQARGITLDLGFSAFDVDVSSNPAFAAADVARVQFTLVDCPGHASLIRTVLGGAQIIDLMILVIDITKGIQTQTAECIVVGEILSRRLVVVLNKIDTVQGETEERRRETIAKTSRKLRAVFAKTRWPNAPFIEVTANPGAGNVPEPPSGLDELRAAITEVAAGEIQRRLVAHSADTGHKDFLMLVDHCFPIKGQGTVLTGTVLQGSVKVGDDLCFPDHGHTTKRIKGIQMFKKPVNVARQGDRVGVCVSQFAAESMERGVVCATGCTSVLSVKTFISRVFKVRFHKMPVEPGLKYHITVGHATVMGILRFFSRAELTPHSASFDFAANYDAVDELPDDSIARFAESAAPDARPEDFLPPVEGPTTYYAVVQLEQPVTTVLGAVFIVSRLDTDIHVTSCRIAAHGVVLTPELEQRMFPTSFAPEEEPWRMISVVKQKTKQISIDRVIDETSCISKSITSESRDKNPARFIGSHVTLRKIPLNGTKGVKPTESATAVESIPGVIDAPFGNVGKVRLVFSRPVFDKPKQRGEAKPSAQAASDEPISSGRSRIEILLSYRKYPFKTLHRFQREDISR